MTASRWLQRLQGFVTGEAPPIARTIGFRATAVGEGTASFVLVADMTRRTNPMGTMYGGVLVDLGDAAMTLDPVGGTLRVRQSLISAIDARTGTVLWTSTRGSGNDSDRSAPRAACTSRARLSRRIRR